MSAMEPLSSSLGLNSDQFSKEEFLLLEIELFVRVCEELQKYFKLKLKDLFKIFKSSMDRENCMQEENIIYFVCKDILYSEEYSLRGIAQYTQIPEDVICDILVGRNLAPSLPVSRRLIALHRMVRPELYRSIIKKIAAAYAALK